MEETREVAARNWDRDRGCGVNILVEPSLDTAQVVTVQGPIKRDAQQQADEGAQVKVKHEVVRGVSIFAIGELHHDCDRRGVKHAMDLRVIGTTAVTGALTAAKIPHKLV